MLGEHPRDALALQAGHLMDFYRGDALNLRNRVSRVLPHWNESVPGFSYVLGMHAFGLEEMNQYAEAEAAARRALALETQGRLGRARGHARDGDAGSHRRGRGVAHVARGRLVAGQRVRVPQLVAPRAVPPRRARATTTRSRCTTRASIPGPAQFALTLLDATALLWRLRLEGVDVGDRFATVADEWEARLEQDRGFYAFNDVHAMLAFVATGRAAASERLLPRTWRSRRRAAGPTPR